MTDGELAQLCGEGLERALAVLVGCGIEPEVVVTRSPRVEHERGHLRVLSIREGGAKLIVARFSDEVESTC